MAYTFLDIATTPGVKAAQAAYGSRDLWAGFHGHRLSERLTEAEKEFIAARDSFYLATVSEAGWPYVQHRGGPAGFLRVLDDSTLAFADYRGNRQYISVGNAGANDKAALILMDYVNRRRLKIYARLDVTDAASDAALARALAPPDSRIKVERIVKLKLAAYDWNCPQHITPRFTLDELEEALAPVREKMAALEAENRALREKAAAAPAG
jgi:hypothetical protein